MVRIFHISVNFKSVIMRNYKALVPPQNAFFNKIILLYLYNNLIVNVLYF